MTQIAVASSFKGAMRCAVLLSSARISMPMAPWATAGSMCSVAMACVMRSDNPKRRNPAQARNVASATPSSSLRNLDCTLPRKPTTSRSGRKRLTWAWRRSDEVPTTAPWGNASSEPYLTLMKASRTSSRASVAPIIRPSGKAVCMSFIECTASAISPPSRASSISFVNKPLPPTSANGRSRIISPDVLMTTISNALSGMPCAAISNARTSWACANASADPRVPILIVRPCKRFSPGVRGWGIVMPATRLERKRERIY